MKYLQLLIIILISQALTPEAFALNRKWTDKRGKVFEAEIVDFEMCNKSTLLHRHKAGVDCYRIKFRLNTGNESVVYLSSLSTDDQLVVYEIISAKYENDLAEINKRINDRVKQEALKREQQAARRQAYIEEQARLRIEEAERARVANLANNSAPDSLPKHLQPENIIPWSSSGPKSLSQTKTRIPDDQANDSKTFTQARSPDQTIIAGVLFNHFVGYYHLLITIPIAWYFCIRLEKKRISIHPNTRPYRWGYFLGVWGLSSVPLVIVALVASEIMNPHDNEASIAMPLYIMLGGLLCYGVLKRNRYAWILFTIMSLNPVAWVVNGIYIYNRWKEMTKEADTRN